MWATIEVDSKIIDENILFLSIYLVEGGEGGGGSKVVPISPDIESQYYYLIFESRVWKEMWKRIFAMDRKVELYISGLTGCWNFYPVSLVLIRY